ncbi:MAG TPA: DUF2240 family protein [Methanomassiliicoccales archaeon]|nr:DUF2240 family protein [Methanomassiliicoccales archaeon]
MGELDKTLAIVFKRKGKSMLSEKEFINTMLFDMRWSDPGKSPKIDAQTAQKILDAGIRSGLLTLTEGVLKPNFDPRAMDIPLNYQPSKAIVQEIGGTAAAPPAPQATVMKPAEPKPEPPATGTPAPDVPIFSVIIEDIAQRTGLKKKDVVARINKLQDRLTLVPEVAALIVARENGMDLAKYFEAVQMEISKK